jgi:DNA gyrase subunit A
VNMVALVDNVPRQLPLRSVIHNYVGHQREIIVRRSKHELRQLEAQVHRLEGLLVALENLDEVIALIRAASDRDHARSGLMERFELSHLQAQAILDLRLQQLTALEADTIRREHADKVERIGELRELLGDEDKVLMLIKEELAEIAERYGDERRTQIAPTEDDLDIEDLIADQQMVISITASGYIKSLPLTTYRQQRRGGVGIIGMDTKDDDYIEHLFVSSTHDYLLFFTNRGKVYRSKVYDLPEAPRQSKGRFLGNVLPLREGEQVQSVLATRDFTESEFLVFATRNGTVKKTALQAYNTPIKADGIIAINIRDDDELVAVRRVDQGDEILMVSHAGLTVRFREEDARAMGRDTTGVRGMDVSGKDNYLLAMDVARPGQDLLVVTENGYGKRTGIDEYRLTKRGTKGVKTINFVESKGLLAAALVVREHQELVFISQNGMVQRTSVRGINRYGRTSQGVRVMNLRESDEVSAVALIVESEAASEEVQDSAVVEPVTLHADGDADEPVLAEADVIEPDPEDESTLQPPEVVEDDGMPDSPIED